MRLIGRQPPDAESSPDKPRPPFVRRVTVAELYTIVAPTSGVTGQPPGSAPEPSADRWTTTGSETSSTVNTAKVVATVALVCGSVATAEDSVQEALARAWERLDCGDGIDRLPAWVTTVALNLARSQMRRWRSERRARDRLGPLRDDLSNAPAASGDAHAVREALRALPRRQREVTVLRYYLGLDVREIAEHLGIAEGTVKAMLFRARQSLAVTLADDDEPDEREPRGGGPCRRMTPASNKRCTTLHPTFRRSAWSRRSRAAGPDGAATAGSPLRALRTRRAPRGRHRSPSLATAVTMARRRTSPRPVPTCRPG